MKNRLNSFTMVDNRILNNKDLSLSSKGLYSFLCSKPDDWEFSQNGLVSQLKEGSKAIKTATRQLEEAKALARVRAVSKRGVWGFEYILNPTPDDMRQSREDLNVCASKGVDPKGVDPKGVDPKGVDPKGVDIVILKPSNTKPSNTKPSNTKPSNTKKLPIAKPRDFKYPNNFEDIWRVHPFGDKWKAYRAYNTIRGGYTDEILIQALNKEKLKEFAIRHTSTIFNGDIDDLLSRTQQPNTKRNPLDLSGVSYNDIKTGDRL